MTTTTNDTGKPLTKAPTMGKPRGKIMNTGDPRGQFGAFLRDWLDRKHEGSPEALAKSLRISVRTVQHWASGSGGPPFGDLDRVAVAIGYSDFAAMAAAVKRFNNKY